MRTRDLDLRAHFVTDDRVPFADLVAIVADVVAAGIPVVQLRDKTVSDAEVLERATRLADVMAGGTSILLIDDRVDVALEARRRGVRIDGVHLGQSDMNPRRARSVLGDDAVIGWTANTDEHFAEAGRKPRGTLDYLGVGVIRATATKPDHPAPLGIDGFRALAATSALPCVAIGGVGIDDIEALTDPSPDRIGRPAAGVAVVSALSAAPDPAAAARAIMAALPRRDTSAWRDAPARSGASA
ncbi:thiamine phosphate synthase [uncultured Microbacterium sp.]|uniref:thiamine phosphate synthase n=1 Tax=uncultured Microbacterium sp. TaxID=191216 RepID=UPI0025F576E4|nr:thiamine phosphate synthase [uncultured Microbacterium sp.]